MGPVAKAALDLLEPPGALVPQDDGLPNSSADALEPHGSADRLASDTSIASLTTEHASVGDIVTVLGNTRAALLASLPVNMDAVDQALATMVSEVEGLGGEVVGWLDESGLPPWAVVTSAVAAGSLGGRYLWQKRNRR